MDTQPGDASGPWTGSWLAEHPLGSPVVWTVPEGERTPRASGWGPGPGSRPGTLPGHGETSGKTRLGPSSGPVPRDSLVYVITGWNRRMKENKMLVY
ncbi:MAG: hypothetical protein JO182_09300 [Acidobacteriaceae bacterium]|nr:hypothetical protein [Acidobacteriaceae bacterium]MBV9676368.1 hypothetical protein [Acidobacteriaceae bacterium]